MTFQEWYNLPFQFRGAEKPKYRIVEDATPGGHPWFIVERRFLGIWWRSPFPDFLFTLKDAEKSIERRKGGKKIVATYS